MHVVPSCKSSIHACMRDHQIYLLHLQEKKKEQKKELYKIEAN
jgi:hypothetical protein